MDYLKEYHMSVVYCSPTDLRPFLQRIKDNDVSPKAIVIEDMILGDYEVKVLSEMLIVNKVLEYVRINRCNLYDGSIVILATALRRNRSLKYLDMAENHISFIGANDLFQSLKINRSIVYVNLSGNDLSFNYDSTLEIFGILEANRTITDINVSRNKLDEEMIVSFLKSLEGSQVVKHLSIGYNFLENSVLPCLKNVFSQFCKIQWLDVSGCQFDTEGMSYLLCDILKDSKTLKYLDIKNWEHFSEHTDIFDEINSLDNLTYINISENSNLDRLENISFNNNLKIAKIRKCELSSIALRDVGDALAKNKSIESLDIAYNLFEENCNFFNILCQNYSITELDFSGNIVLQSDNFLSFVKKKQIKKLVLNDTKGLSLFREAFEAFGSHPSLEHLELRNIELGEEMSLYFRNCCSQNTVLKYLDISGNNFSEELDIIEQWIDLYNNHVNLLEFKLDGCQDNERLSQKSFSNFELQEFPETVLEMRNLVSLDISNNRIKYLPTALRTLDKLVTLDCSNNQIEVLPTSLGYMNKLENLLVSGNPVMKHPDFAGKNSQQILRYLNDLEDTSTSYSASLMLIGEPKTGKTNLLKTIQKKLKNKKEISKEGVIIEDYQVDVELPNEKTLFNLRTYDFELEEDIYKSVCRHYIHDNTITLVVFDLQNVMNLDFWLNTVNDQTKESSIIIVATGAEKYEAASDILDILYRVNGYYKPLFPQILDVMAVDLETGELGALLERIIECFESQDKYTVQVPKYIENFYKKIIERQYSFIENEILIQAAHFCQIEKGELHKALKLVQLVYHLQYFYDKELHFSVVLTDPLYLCYIVNSLYGTHLSKFMNGLVAYEDCKLIWTPPIFSNLDFPVIIGILFQMDLIYYSEYNLNHQLPHKALFGALVGNRCNTPAVLVPFFLDDDVTEFILWNSSKNFKRHYNRIIELQIFPNSLMNKIIFSMLSTATEILHYWKKGIVGKIGQDEFIIKVSEKNRKVYVSVRGNLNPAECFDCCVSTVRMWISLASAEILTKEFIPCPFCLSQTGSYSAHTFTYGELELRASKYHQTIECSNARSNIEIKSIAPDISLQELAVQPYTYSKLEIIKEIGKGAFGTIYKGYWEDKLVAIKSLDTLMDTDEVLQAAYADIKHEIRTMINLKHPNLVRIFAYTTEPVAIVMELIPCGNLYEFVNDESSPKDWEISLRIAIDVARGLRFLHELTPSIVHRDLKSPNVLMKSYDPNAPVCAIVADFGLSTKLFVPSMKESTADRDVVNPTWLAPEVMREEFFDERADVYSFGIILWELVARKHPFAEFNFRFMFEEEDAIKNGVRPSLPYYCPHIYSELVEKCWDDNMNERPSFREIVDYLLKMRDILAPLLNIPDEDNDENSLGESSQEEIPTGELSLIGYPETNNVKFYTICAVGNQIWASTREGNIECFSSITGQPIGTWKNVLPSYITNIILTEKEIVTSSPMQSFRQWKYPSLEKLQYSELEDNLKIQDNSGTFFLKSTSKSTFESHYFHIQGRYMIIFKHKDSNIPLYRFNLVDAQIHADKAKKGTKFCMTLIPKNKNPVYMYWDKEPDMMKCYDNINDTIYSKPKNFTLQFAFGTRTTSSVCVTVVDGITWAGGTDIKKFKSSSGVEYNIDISQYTDSTVADLGIRKMFYTGGDRVWIAVGKYLVCIEKENLTVLGFCQGHSTPINDIVAVKDMICTCGDDGMIILWDSNSYEKIREVQVSESRLFCLISRDTTIYTGGFSGILYCYDIENDILSESKQAHMDCITGIAESNGRFWVSSWDGISVWE
eukprot:TRINITY_DN5184_c0_g1_i1.p1 TRINITY_DN5184_c0_g1~~TRINITY_DN5184_c0_g1_i1.p1  ORF type:complete len:1792 (+),score=310.50 TRINITY_DN5184_c0_g1_i1:31-5376(+)